MIHIDELESNARSLALSYGDFGTYAFLSRANARKQLTQFMAKDACESIYKEFPTRAPSTELVRIADARAAGFIRSCKILFALICDESYKGEECRLTVLREQSKVAQRIFKALPRPDATIEHCVRINRIKKDEHLGIVEAIVAFLIERIVAHWVAESDEDEATSVIDFLLRLLEPLNPLFGYIVASKLREADSRASSIRIAQTMLLIGKLPEYKWGRYGHEVMENLTKALARRLNTEETLAFAKAIIQS